MQYKVIYSIIIILLIAENGFSQCCSAGNPLGSNGINDGLPVKEWQFLTSYKHSLSRDYFHKDHEVEVPLVEKSYFDYQSFSVSYGILKWMNVSAEIGYFYTKAQILEPGQVTDEIRSSGLGDMGINVRVLPFKNLRKISQFIVSGGVRIPDGWSIMALADVPVYKYVNGEQLTNRYALQLSLFKRIQF